jgi:excisionase family DNA binding protein
MSLFLILFAVGRIFARQNSLFFRVRLILYQKFKDSKGESILAHIMTTKEMAHYLKLHEITICKLSKEGKIPAVRIGRVWRFDKEVIDEWIAKG